MKQFTVEYAGKCYVGNTVKLSPTGKDYAVREIKYGTVELIDNNGKTKTVKENRIVYIPFVYTAKDRTEES